MGKTMTESRLEQLQRRESETMKKLSETLAALEETLFMDVKALEPKERVSLYAKLVGYILPKATNERKASSEKEEKNTLREHLKVFGNVLDNLSAAEA